ncbi:MAG: DVU0298 family protein [Candidatus Zixiibacteriota bacterium]
MPSSAGRSKRITKQEILHAIQEYDKTKIRDWASGKKHIFRPLTSLLFDTDPIIYWRAIDMIGLAAGIIGKTDLEKVRKQIRQLFWMMNDESGGLCRRAPETIGEILINVPRLIPEYAERLPLFLWEEPFERGTRFAIYRLMINVPELHGLFIDYLDEYTKSLKSEDEIIRGYSYLIIDASNACPNVEPINIPKINPTVIPVYDFSSGNLSEIRLPC